MGLYIRLNNQFVLKKGKKYFLTDIKKVSEWKGLTSKQKEKSIGKDVTTKIKSLIKKHGSKSNMNFMTKPSKKKIRKTTRKHRVKGGWLPKIKSLKKQSGGWGGVVKPIKTKVQTGGDWPAQSNSILE